MQERARAKRLLLLLRAMRHPKKRGLEGRVFMPAKDGARYCAPILTRVTSKIRVSLGGKPFFGSEP